MLRILTLRRLASVVTIYDQAVVAERKRTKKALDNKHFLLERIWASSHFKHTSHRSL